MAIPQPTIVDGTTLPAPIVAVGVLPFALNTLDGSLVACPALSIFVTPERPFFFFAGFAFRAVRIGEATEVTILDPPAGTLYYHWYIDGAWLGMTTGPTKTFHLLAGEQAAIDCIPTADPDFDPIQNAPAGYSARRTPWWVRSLAADVAAYRVEQQKAGGDWTVLAQVADGGRWCFSYLTGRLDDLTQYAWRIVPIDAIGNDGAPIVLGAETIVRTPDAPDFSVTFDPDTQRATFSAA